MEEYSVSKIKAKLGCGSFKQKEVNSFALEKGSIIHSILEDENNYNKEYSIYRNNKRYYQHTHDFKEYENIVRLVKIHYPEYFEGKWYIEEQFDIEINDKLLGNILLTGIIDKYKIDGDTCTIIDWKSGISVADTNNFIDMLQAHYYMYAISVKYPHLKNITFSYVYVEQFHKITLELNITNEMRDKLFNHIKHFIFAASLTSEDTYRVTKHCTYCNNISSCPLINKNIQNMNDDMNINDIKKYRSIINTLYDNKKIEIIENSNSSNIKTVNYYYINKNDIPDSILVNMLSDNVKITKEQASNLMELGYNVDIKSSKSLK